MRLKKILAGVLGAVILVGAGVYYNTYRTVTYISDNGDIYTGQYHWTSMWRSADDYGRFFRQYRHGYGRAVTRDGWIYEGYWKEGDLHGEARRILPDELLVDGIFDEGMLVEGKRVTYFKHGGSITSEGDWGDHGYVLLKGTQTRQPSGIVVKGTFKKDSICNIPHGKTGSVTFTKDYNDIKAGTVWEANWENGWFTGWGTVTEPDGKDFTYEFHTDYFFKGHIELDGC